MVLVVHVARDDGSPLVLKTVKVRNIITESQVRAIMGSHLQRLSVAPHPLHESVRTGHFDDLRDAGLFVDPHDRPASLTQRGAIVHDHPWCGMEVRLGH